MLPRRESSRLRGVAADGSQVHSERQGEVRAMSCHDAAVKSTPQLLVLLLPLLYPASPAECPRSLSSLGCAATNQSSCFACGAAVQVVIVAGEVIRRYGAGSMSEEQEPQERHPQGEPALPCLLHTILAAVALAARSHSCCLLC